MTQLMIVGLGEMGLTGCQPQGQKWPSTLRALIKTSSHHGWPFEGLD